jgi:hypothetical protein
MFYYIGQPLPRFPLTLSTKATGRCTIASQSTNVVHAWWFSRTFSRAVRDVLNNTYNNRWVGRGGPTTWPPSSPDLNPLDFYLWGHLKSLVHACRTIRITTPASLSGWNVSRRPLNLMENIWSTCYKYTLSAITHKFNVPWRMLIRTFTCFGVWNSCPNFVHTFQSHPVQRRLFAYGE